MTTIIFDQQATSALQLLELPYIKIPKSSSQCETSQSLLIPISKIPATSKKSTQISRSLPLSNDAVTKTGAKHAFMYIVFGTPDNMRSGIEALKEAGIEFVVFLSSEGIQGDVKNVGTSDFIAYSHAQVEINLSEVFGTEGYVAVRPGWFASNSVRWNPMFKDGKVKIFCPEAKWDWISPTDIGRVCGTITARGWQAAGKNIVHLNGPQLMSQRDAVAVIGRALGKEVKVLEIDEAAYMELIVSGAGLPEPIAKHMAKIHIARGAGTDGAFVGQPYEEAVNIFRNMAEENPRRLRSGLLKISRSLRFKY
jgi:uncharacterized protein YbjT (DUF2867 family)